MTSRSSITNKGRPAIKIMPFRKVLELEPGEGAFHGHRQAGNQFYSLSTMLAHNLKREIQMMTYEQPGVS